MSRSAFDYFQPRLPINHPLTETLTNNTPAPSALAAHVGAAPTQHTPAPAPHAPMPVLHEPAQNINPASPTLSPRNLFSPDFDDMKAAELRQYAVEQNINLHRNKKQSALKRIIREHEIERKKMS